MKVLDLRCANGHRFEGWFASDDDFIDQNRRGLVECPICADRVVSRLPSAPRLNLSGAKEPPAKADSGAAKPLPSKPGVPAVTPPPADVDLQAAWLGAVRQLLANTEDVGDRFADEARRIHYGEAENRGIRGQTTPEERAALDDEGIEVLSLPLPAALKGPLQ